MNNEEIYLVCKSYVDNFEVLEVCKDYLKALEELENIKKYSQFKEAEEKYHIYCLEFDKFYSYKEFDDSEVE